MDWFYKFLPVVFLLFYSILLRNGRGVKFLAGFSTMSKNEYDTYNHRAIGRFMGKVFLIAAGGWLLLVIGEEINHIFLHILGLLVFLTSIVFAVVYANTNNRFKLK